MKTLRRYLCERYAHHSMIFAQTDGQSVSMVFQTHLFGRSEADQRSDCRSVEHVKIDGWHRYYYMVASVSTIVSLAGTNI